MAAAVDADGDRSGSESAATARRPGRPARLPATTVTGAATAPEIGTPVRPLPQRRLIRQEPATAPSSAAQGPPGRVRGIGWRPARGGCGVRSVAVASRRRVHFRAARSAAAAEPAAGFLTRDGWPSPFGRCGAPANGSGRAPRLIVVARLALAAPHFGQRSAALPKRALHLGHSRTSNGIWHCAQASATSSLTVSQRGHIMSNSASSVKTLTHHPNCRGSAWCDLRTRHITTIDTACDFV